MNTSVGRTQVLEVRGTSLLVHPRDGRVGHDALLELASLGASLTVYEGNNS